MEMNNIIKDYEELLKSLLCLSCNEIPSNLLISHCEHIFCENCVDTLLRRRIVKCPNCNINLNRRNFCPNPTVTNLISSLSILKKSLDMDQQEKEKEETSPEKSCHFVVSKSLIENYLENNLPSCDLKCNEIESSESEFQKNDKEKLNTSFDEFISVSQLPTPINSKNPSPLRVYTRKLKPVEKVKSWLSKHTSDFTNITLSQKKYIEEVDELGYTITQPSFSQINAYVAPRNKMSDGISSQDTSSKDLNSCEKSSGNEDETLSKINQICKVQLTDVQKQISLSNEGSVTLSISELNKKEKVTVNANIDVLNVVKNKTKSNAMEKQNFGKIPSMDLFSTNFEEDTSSPKCNQAQEKDFQFQKNTKSKMRLSNTLAKISNPRKTFSLDANTEDLQNIGNEVQENTQEMLRNIFEKRIGQTQCTAGDQIKTQKYPPTNTPLCTFIKGANLSSNSYKFRKSQKQTVLFLLKGRLISTHSHTRNKAIQTVENIETPMEIVTEKQILADIGTQTNFEQIPSDCTSYVSDSEGEKELHKIRNNSPEIAIVENISNIDVTIIPNYNNDQIDISYENKSSNHHDVEITDDNPRSSKRSDLGIENINNKRSDLGTENINNKRSDLGIENINNKRSDLGIENINNKRSDLGIENINNKRSDLGTENINNKRPNEQNSKRKRSSDKSITSGRPSKTFKRIRNTSVSSDSDSEFQSCLQPIKQISYNTDDLNMEEDMTVKFISLHESENNNSEMLLKHKLKHLTPSSGSSLKENDVAKEPVIDQDSEPLNYDEILSTVFANIDADLDPSKKMEHPKINYNKDETTSSYLNNITNKVKTKSPVKKVKEPLKSNFENITERFNIPSSTPICNEKKNKIFGTANKNLDISVESLNKTSDIVRIVGALESDFMQKELETQNRAEISFEDQEISKIDQNVILDRNTDSENEVQKTPGLLTYRPHTSKSKKKNLSTKSKRSLVFLDNNSKSPSTQEQSEARSSKNALDETISTIIDYPKTLSEKIHNISVKKNRDQNEISDMELCSPMDDFMTTEFVTEKTLVPENKKSVQSSNKSQELILNTEKTPMKYPESDLDFVPNSLEMKQYCIACSCLTQDEIQLVKRFADQFNLRFVTQYEDDVTHLIVRVNKQNCGERSLKFISAMAAGIWAVNKNWISDSLSAKKLLPEEKYEALDVSSEPGPKRNRNAIRKTLFNSLKVSVIGPFNSTSTEQIRSLLQKTGITITSNGAGAAMVVVDENLHSEDQIEVLYMKYKLPVVDIMWFLDCICRGRVTNITEFIIHPDVSEIDPGKYPQEWFQGTEQYTENI